MSNQTPSQRSYLRPCGLAPASPATRNTSPDDGGYPGTLPLCGDGPFDFTAIELITRDGAAVTRRLRPLSDLWDSDINPALLPMHTILERLTSQRRRIAGLRMDRAQLMGIVNVTPDSFSDGGQFSSSAEASSTRCGWPR